MPGSRIDSMVDRVSTIPIEMRIKEIMETERIKDNTTESRRAGDTTAEGSGIICVDLFCN